MALEHAPAGAQFYATTEEGVPVQDIAETIARHLGIPARSIPDDELEAYFGAFRLIGMGVTMPNESGSFSTGSLSTPASSPTLTRDTTSRHPVKYAPLNTQRGRCRRPAG